MTEISVQTNSRYLPILFLQIIFHEYVTHKKINKNNDFTQRVYFFERSQPHRDDTSDLYKCN